MKIRIIVAIIVITILLCLTLENCLYADEIYLKNKDRVSGKIIKEDNGVVVIETQAMGLLSIKKEFVERISADEIIRPVEEKEDVLWEREFSLGYNKSNGNTQNSQFSTRLFIHRKTDHNEFHLQGDSFYSSSNKEMDAQKYNGMIRYAFSFAESKWYNFYKFEANHDRFANIDYRIIPSTGLGYWFSDQEDWKLMSELGLGLEHTSYRDNTKNDNEVVLIPRAFFEKKLFGESKISQDTTLYPSLEDTSEYRLHSETAFINPINGSLSVKFSLIDDYDSDPPTNTKKNDLRFISSLIYSF